MKNLKKIELKENVAYLQFHQEIVMKKFYIHI